MDRIIYTDFEGNCCIVVPSPNYQGTLLELELSLTSRGDLLTLDEPEHVDASEIPSDRTFRGSWKRGEQGNKIGVDMIKVKEFSHEKRRAKRNALFAPLDVKATIPSEAAQAELDRQAIRDQDASVQNDIDASTTPEELKQVLVNYGAI